MRVTLTLSCTAGANTFYFAPLIPCLVREANYVANANQGGTKTCVISKKSGNTIISGDINATAGTPTSGALTATLADKKQVINKTNPLQIAIDLTNGTAATVIMQLDLDEFQVHTE
jgi:hypothetical protein